MPATGGVYLDTADVLAQGAYWRPLLDRNAVPYAMRASVIAIVDAFNAMQVDVLSRETRDAPKQAKPVSQSEHLRVGEAAEVTGWSTQYVRRLAKQSGCSRNAAGHWQIPRHLPAKWKRRPDDEPQLDAAGGS